MLLLSAALLTACIDNSKVPDEALVYTVEVTGTVDTCHTDGALDDGWQETFEYAVAFDASSADLYMDGQPFAAGTLSGCNLTYQSVVIGDDERTVENDDGTVVAAPIKWQLTGTSKIETDASGDACVDGDTEWAGTETITVISAEDDEADESKRVEPGCTYSMDTVGDYVPSEG